MAIVDLLVKSASSPQLSAGNATVQHQVALLLHGDYTKWAWLSFSAAAYIFSGMATHLMSNPNLPFNAGASIM